MNFNGFDFDENIKNSLQMLDSQNRIPHAIVIECANSQKSANFAKFLSMWAVCKGENKPCTTCDQCHKASKKAHADISYAYPEKKSKTYSIEQLRDIARDAYIRPNEAAAKVYILENADARLLPIAQNSFLKLLEEPPDNVIFILTCENSKKLLNTILSRCTVFRIGSEQRFNDTAVQLAKEIAEGLLSAREYNLLKSLYSLSDKDIAAEVLTIVKLILRDGLAILSGTKAVFDENFGRKTAARLTKMQIIQAIELTEEAKQKLLQNININLLTTWLCGKYRRIIWQR